MVNGQLYTGQNHRPVSQASESMVHTGYLEFRLFGGVSISFSTLDGPLDRILSHDSRRIPQAQF
jgi:hypothetical protein